MALVASALAAQPGRACDATPPDLHARQVGADVVLTWTGALAAGEIWNVHRGDLNVLWDVGFNDTSLATVATAQYTDVAGAADADWDYFRVRCEGPGGDGPWSNLGFKVLRQFDTVQEGGTGGDFLNLYYVSLPERLGMPDIADSRDPNPCAPAAGVGDGIVTADDLLCSWWTSGTGSFMVSGFDAATCTFLDRMILREESDCTSAPETLFVGSWTAPLSDGQALQVSVTRQPGVAPAVNSALTVGSADPARPCQVIAEPALGPGGVDCAPRQRLLSIPWDGLDRQARELLCGREGRDWVYSDAPTNRKPSACNAGIFNNSVGFRKATAAGTFDNVGDGSTDNQYTWSSISFSALTGLSFGGVIVDLRPTDAAYVFLSLGHGSTTYCPERR
jgi:hypothetical protein